MSVEVDGSGRSEHQRSVSVQTILLRCLVNNAIEVVLSVRIALLLLSKCISATHCHVRSDPLFVTSICGGWPLATKGTLTLVTAARYYESLRSTVTLRLGRLLRGELGCILRLATFVNLMMVARLITDDLFDMLVET